MRSPIPTPYSVKLLKRFAGTANSLVSERIKVEKGHAEQRMALRREKLLRHLGAVSCAAPLALAAILSFAAVVAALATTLSFAIILAFTRVLARVLV